MSHSIDLQKLSFAYDKSESYIFENLSLTLPGGMTSLVGQNGCGKTTLLLLAGGRLFPSSGKVLVDGMDTVQIKEEEQRNRRNHSAMTNRL